MVFQVKLQKSGQEFSVGESETVLDAALKNGLVIPYSCRSGTCGSCKSRIVSGRVDYGEYQGGALTEAEQAAGMALLCQARPASDLVVDAREVPVSQEIEIKMLPCRVSQLEKLNHDVMLMSLKLPQNKEFAYLAGQYIDILLRDGRRRSFSLAASPSPGRDLQLHVRLVPGGYFTGQVFNSMKERDLLRLQGPLGTFFLREDSARPVILVAGGTGFAPIKAIVEHAIEKSNERPMHLFWGARSQDDLYMDELARRWSEQHPWLKYTPVLSEDDGASGWAGATGWVHEAVVERYPHLAAFEVYMSGPPPMIDAGSAAFLQHGLPEECLYFDSFEFAADVPQG